MSDEGGEAVFNNGSDYFNRMVHDIDQAQHCIDLETYIFSNDRTGLRIAQALYRASRRGVHVRVLVDGCGTPHWGVSLADIIEKCGGKSKVFHPFPWQIWNWSRSVVKAPSLLKAIYLVLTANTRNHRKVCLIDHCIAYTGSMNIHRSHLNYSDGGDAWRDTGIRLSSTDLSDLEAAFNSAWKHRSIKERIRTVFQHIKTNPTIRLNYNRHRRRILYKNLLRRISQCQQRIWITNAYFVPDTFLLKRLRDAARRGVDVRILLPRKSDHFIMPWASSAFYANLLKAGIRVFEYLPSVLHAKTLIIDDWILIGSSNLNHRSLLHDLEVDIHVETQSSKQILSEQFLADLNHSAEVSLNNWSLKRPWYQRLFGRIFLYVKYWI